MTLFISYIFVSCLLSALIVIIYLSLKTIKLI